MTHNTQGGVARYRRKPGNIVEAQQYTEYGKLVKGMCNSVSCYTAGNNKPHVHTIHDNQIVLLEVGDWVLPEPDGEHYYPVKPDIFDKTYEPESPLPASPEGTWETEFEKLYAKKNYYNLVSFVQSIFQPLQQENEFKRNMIADLDSMNERLKQENERLKEELEDSITFSKKAIEIATDEMAKLKSQLAEAREALRQAEAGLEFAGADKQIPDDDFVPTPTLALRAVRSALK